MSGVTIDPPVVTAYTRPYSSTYEAYQAYYRQGIRLHCAAVGALFRECSMSRGSSLLRSLRYVRERFVARLPVGQPAHVLDRAAHVLEGPLQTPSSAFYALVGQYVFESDGQLRRVCIDSADYPTCPNPELVEWSDLYFKTNHWPEREYPPHARPLVNADPLVLGELPWLRARRATRKDLDLCFVTRVWGGEDEVGGVEHCLRLLEAVNKARCSKVLVAVLVTGDLDGQRQRLSRAGITCSTKFLPRQSLWELTARARLNVIRLGMHACVPWRMTGALAIGSCPVLDQSPPAQWPQPLLENSQFLSLGVDTAASHLADQARYDDIPELIEAWLAEPEAIEGIGAATAAYFDQYMEPRAVGAHIIAEVEAAPGTGRRSEE